MQLEGPSGEIWNVAIQGRTLDNLAFTNGWEEFVKDHGLSVGDLLLFKLLSRGFFSVTMYGNDGCEKADAFTVQNSRARLMANAHGSKKRPAAEKVLDCESTGMETKRRKVVCDKQVAPIIIDIDDDEDQEDDLIIISEVEPDNANQSTMLNGNDVSSFKPINNNLSAQIEQAKIVESTCQPHVAQNISASCMLAAQQVTCCSVDTKEDTLSHLNLVELPPTPSNADKSNLPIIMQTELHLQVNSSSAKCNSLKEDSTEFSEQEASSSDESDNEDCYNCQAHVKQAEKSSQEKTVAMDSLCSLNESLQHDRLKAFLAKDYMTEAFISKRRPVSAEERQKALLAAKRFKSNRPHLRKLMKESHVYRGFWLGLSSDFSSEHLPSEIQEATLLDASGKAWSARWLGSRSGLSGGWRKFSLDHGLEEGDVCVFELIDKNKLIFKVHVFRVVELRNELPGRDHYLRKPQSRPLIGHSSTKSSIPLIGYNSKKSSRPLIGYNSRKSSGSVKKMRGAIASKNTHNVAEDTSCLHTPPTSREPFPENLRLNHLAASRGRAVARQLDPLFDRSENRLLQSVSKLASTSSEEVAHDSKAKASKKYYTVERLFNRRKGIVEEEFLVELEGETLTPSSSRVKREGSAWWVPLSHFTKDKMSCHL